MDMVSRPPRGGKPALRYYGSKWRLAPAIIALMPGHRCYCEPFGGSMAVLLQKPSTPIEVYNDLDSAVVTFFRVLRERPAELIRAIELTPHAREEMEKARLRQDDQDSLDELEIARRLYVSSWQTWAGAAGGRSRAWRFDRTTARNRKPVNEAWNETGHLWEIAKRLRTVQIEHDDALRVIQRYDTRETLYYVDPPYLAETRRQGGRNGYRHELDETGHRELARVLNGLRGMVILSSYPNALYGELFSSWTSVEHQSVTEYGRKATEVLWLSPALARERLPLFNSARCRP